MSAETLRRAAAKLREHFGGLTEGERAEWWQAGGVHGDGEHWWVGAAGLSIANCGIGDSAQAAAEHIALAHNAATFLPALLDAIAEHAESNDEFDGFDPALVITGWVEANALADLVLREGMDAHG